MEGDGTGNSDPPGQASRLCPGLGKGVLGRYDTHTSAHMCAHTHAHATGLGAVRADVWGVLPLCELPV